MTAVLANVGWGAPLDGMLEIDWVTAGLERGEDVASIVTTRLLDYEHVGVDPSTVLGFSWDRESDVERWGDWRAARRAAREEQMFVVVDGMLIARESLKFTEGSSAKFDTAVWPAWQAGWTEQMHAWGPGAADALGAPGWHLWVTVED